MRDLALLEFDPELGRLGLGARVLSFGDISIYDTSSSLLEIGYPESGFSPDGIVSVPSGNTGMLAQIYETDAGGELRIDARVEQGDIGAPVLNSAGQVVGMVREARGLDGNGLSVVGAFYATHVDEIKAAYVDLARRISNYE